MGFLAEEEAIEGAVRLVERIRWTLRRSRLLNDARQLSWPVIWLGLLFLLTGLAGFLEGPVPYPSFFGPALIESHRRLSTDLIAIGLTVLIIDTASSWRAIQQEKKRLIRQMGSSVRGEAVRATEEMRATGWLFDGSLKDADLADADLEKAILSFADLKGTDLMGANLEGADLWFTRLEGADLGSTNLQRVILAGTVLQEANLWHADLRGAEWVIVDQLRQAASLKGATLPDGTTLPDDDTWEEAFEAWCETVETDKEGFIKVKD